MKASGNSVIKRDVLVNSIIKPLFNMALATKEMFLGRLCEQQSTVFLMSPTQDQRKRRSDRLQEFP